MTAAREMRGLFAEVAGASQRVSVVRRRARTGAVGSIRELESALQTAIAGDTLRGMPNLNPFHGKPPVPGMRVVPAAGNPDAKVQPGRRALILSKDGTLQVMEAQSSGSTVVRDAVDEDFYAQDLDAVLHTVSVALTRHIRYAERTVENYERLIGLAESLTAAIRANPGVRPA